MSRIAGLALAAVAMAAACTSGGAETAPATDAPSAGAATTAPSADANLTGDIVIDGSSTVYPITEAVAEEFQKANPGVKVSVAFSGTGGGFKKFCAGETDANDASRPIKTEDAADAKSEATTCKEKGIDPIELQVAYDGLVLVNPQNGVLPHGELKSIWDTGSTVATWADVRAGWPADPIKLFGPGADSGTFDYFTEAINGKAKQSRSDYTQSEDDNARVIGIAGDRNSATSASPFERTVTAHSGRQRHRLVAPSNETIADGTYKPLSRPLFIYASTKALQRPEFAAFVQYYLENANGFVDEVGYIEIPADRLQASKDALAAALK
jgi:phosphate transport system substrate-binding protein